MKLLKPLHPNIIMKQNKLEHELGDELLKVCKELERISIAVTKSGLSDRLVSLLKQTSLVNLFVAVVITRKGVKLWKIDNSVPPIVDIDEDDLLDESIKQNRLETKKISLDRGVG